MLDIIALIAILNINFKNNPQKVLLYVACAERIL